MLFYLTLKFYQEIRTNIHKRQLPESLTNVSLNIRGFEHYKGPSWKVEHDFQDN